MLDASTRIDVLNLLADLKAADLGIRFITHDLSSNPINDGTVTFDIERSATWATPRRSSRTRHPDTPMLLPSDPRVVAIGGQRRRAAAGALEASALGTYPLEHMAAKRPEMAARWRRTLGSRGVHEEGDEVNTIVVGVDGSAGSVDALRFAIDGRGSPMPA